MKSATREYIEFFGVYEQIEKVLDNLFQLLRDSVAESDFHYYTRLRSSFDMTGLVDRIAVSLETNFTDDELFEMVRLTRAHPVLFKFLKSQDLLMAAQQAAASDMVTAAVERMPFLVADGEC